MTRSHWILPLCLLGFVAAGCGGTATEGADEGSTGGSSSGGHGTGGHGTGGSVSPSTGGSATGGAGSNSGGSAGSGAAPGAGGGIGECCLAEATCKDGDVEVASKDDCPVGATCYYDQVCCSTVWCIATEVQCDGIPVCGEDEIEVDVCPEDATCHTRSLCGTSILCQSTVCNPEHDPFRNYVGDSPEECALIDFACQEHTVLFSDACGCGCEQPSTCPEWVNCEPVVQGTPNPLCTSEECPFSMRVY